MSGPENRPPTALEEVGLEATQNALDRLNPDSARKSGTAVTTPEQVKELARNEIARELRTKLPPSELEEINIKIENAGDEVEGLAQTLQEVAEEIKQSNLWLLLNGSQKEKSGAFIALFVQTRAEAGENIYSINDDGTAFGKTIIALSGIVDTEEEGAVLGEIRQQIREIRKRYPQANGLRFDADDKLHVFSITGKDKEKKAEELGTVFENPAAPENSSEEVAESFTPAEKKSAGEKLKKFLQAQTAPTDLSDGTLAVPIPDMTAGESAALGTIVAAIENDFPEAEQIEMKDGKVRLLAEGQNPVPINLEDYAAAETPPETDQSPKSGPEKPPFTEEEKREAWKKLEAYLKEHEGEQGFSISSEDNKGLPDIAKPTPGEGNALKAIFVKIVEKFPHASWIKSERKLLADGKLFGRVISVSVDKSDWKTVELDKLGVEAVAPQPSPETKGAPPSPDLMRQERLTLLSYLKENGETDWGKEISGTENIKTEIAGRYKEFKIFSIKYESGKVSVFMAPNDKPDAKDWKEVSLGSSPAEAYLSSLERFDAKIEAGEGTLFKLLAGILKSLPFKIDLQDLVRDSGMIGSVLRSIFSIAVPNEEMPKAPPAEIIKKLKEMIRNRQDRDFPLNNVDDAAQKDPKFLRLVKNLGDIFNLSDAPVQIVEAKADRKADAKDARHVDETAGTLVLSTPDPNTAAAILQYAQKRSHTMVQAAAGYLDKMGSTFRDAIKGIAGGGSSQVNKYIKKNDEDVPDNIVASSKGIANGAYQVQILWYSDANLVPVDASEEDEGSSEKNTPDGKKEKPTASTTTNKSEQSAK